MASASSKSTAFFHQNGKMDPLLQNSNQEISQDMQLKMSKKIAQLTKVIYALNTKNDEHEAVVQSLNDQHKEEMQRLLAETKQRLEHYKSEIDKVAESSQKVKNLEKLVNSYQAEKDTALKQFEAFKRECSQKESELAKQHSTKLANIGVEVVEIKKNFETKVLQLDKANMAVQREKIQIIEELQNKHQQEIEKLLQEQSRGKDEAKEAMEKRHQAELEKLKEKLERLENDRNQDQQNFDAKLAKQKAFYDKELEAMKAAASATSEEQLKIAHEKISQLEKELRFTESQLKSRVDSLLKQIESLESQAAQQTNDNATMLKQLELRDLDNSKLQQELTAVKQQLTEATHRLNESITNCNRMQDTVSMQEKELVKKAGEISSLSATRLQLEATVSDLSTQLKQVKDKAALLEGQKTSLESQSESQTKDLLKKGASLEQALQDAMKDQKKAQEKYESELKKRDDQIQQLEQLTKSLQDTVKQVREEAERDKKKLESDFAVTIQQIKQECDSLLAGETSKLNSAMQASVGDLQQQNKSLTDKLNKAEVETVRLSKVIEEQVRELGVSADKISAVNSTNNQLRSQLEKSNADLVASNQKIAQLQAEVERLLHDSDKTVKDSEVELQRKLAELTQTLDKKWQETLRNEVARVQEEISAQKEEDKRASLAQLAKRKDQELEASRLGWEQKMKDQMTEIMSLRRQLEQQQSAGSVEMERMRQLMDAERQQAESQLQRLLQEAERRFVLAEQGHEQRIAELQASHDAALKALEERLIQKHADELRAEFTANRTLIDLTKAEAEKALALALETQAAKLLSEKQLLQSELERHHTAQADQLTRNHAQQMQAARMELERVVELSKLKEREHSQKVASLEETIRHKVSAIDGLETEIKRLQHGIGELTKEVEAKNKQIAKIRNEALMSIRQREDELQRAHEATLEEAKRTHKQQVEVMLREFSEAQQLMKDKINELSLLLDEAAERYKMRESRTEDLEMIQALRESVFEKEEHIRKLEDEKRFYQLELVNRETNFNKIFNTTPNVGLLNPLAKKSKSADKAGPGAPLRQFPSNSSLSTLPPLPGGHTSDLKFPPGNPLPPPPRKFL